jgi:multimeric flavodoxin WrbA
MDMPLEDICMELCARLGQRLIHQDIVPIKSPSIVALHSSHRETSNTLELWHMVSGLLQSCRITELHVENGEVLDCKGCSYKACIHYGAGGGCFYGGTMVKNIMPAIEQADAVVWICPNYNDAVSANLTAVINRLTALYRKISFYNKTLFAVIVSGNSGGDSLAKQLIGSLNINKGFRLPPYFALMATANDPGAIEKVPGINGTAESFALNMVNEIKALHCHSTRSL